MRYTKDLTEIKKGMIYRRITRLRHPARDGKAAQDRYSFR